jgi:hypothetical protein
MTDVVDGAKTIIELSAGSELLLMGGPLTCCG